MQAIRFCLQYLLEYNLINNVQRCILYVMYNKRKIAYTYIYRIFNNGAYFAINN